MSGAGYSSSDITHFASCYGITLANGQITQVPVGGGGATGSGTAEAELDIETALSLAPKADIEVYEGGASDSLYDVFSQIVNDDTAKIVSASWTNGCEAYVGQTMQNSENTLFQAAAAEGQSIFVASGDQGAQGCNIKAKMTASTGSDPVAQAVDPSTGTLYVANKGSNTVSVDSEGSTSNSANFTTAGSVSTGSGSGPDAVVLDARAREDLRGRPLDQHADRRLNGHLQPDRDERLRLADPDRFGRPSQLPDGPGGQRLRLDFYVAKGTAPWPCTASAPRPPRTSRR